VDRHRREPQQPHLHPLGHEPILGARRIRVVLASSVRIGNAKAATAPRRLVIRLR
jgi:hypothetical protein